MNNATKIAIVDDNTFFRLSFANQLRQYNGLKIVTEVSDGKQLISTVLINKPDVILLDLEMPIMNGIKTTEYVSKHYPEIKILILTVHDDEEMFHALIEKGANGFLNKSASLNTIIEAINTVVKYDYYFAGRNLKKIVSKGNFINLKNKFSAIDFSEKEIEIIQYICKGFKSKEMAPLLNMSQRTIENYRYRINLKTKTKKVKELIEFATKNKLI